MRHRIHSRIFEDTPYWSNAIVHWLMIAVMILNVAAVVLLLFYVHPSDNLLRLQYNVFFGTSLHAPWWHAYLLPLMGLVFFVIDSFVGFGLYYAKQRVASYIVLLGALFVNIALFVAAVSVVLNNFVS